MIMWIVIIALFLFMLVFLLSLCKAASSSMDERLADEEQIQALEEWRARKLSRKKQRKRG